jgi:hypothetical protein
VNLDLSSRTTLSTAGYFGNDAMSAEFGDEDERLAIGLDWGNRTISSRLRHVLARDLFLSVGAALSKYISTWSFQSDEVLLEEAENELIDSSVKADLEVLGHENHRLKTGVWLRKYDIRFYDKAEDITWVDVDTSTYNLSAYVQDTWRLGPLFELQPGVRAYYHQAGRHVRVDPRLSFVYHHGPDMRFKLSAGRYTQWINIISFGEGFSNFDIWIPVDSSMDPTYTNQLVFGFEYDPKENLEFTTEAYYTDMKNITTFDMLTDRGDVADDAFVSGDGYAYGLEWMLRQTTGRMTGWLGYSLSWTKRRFPDSFVNSGDWYYPKWDRRHDFIALSNYSLNDRWDLSASWRYNTGQGFTQAVGLYTFRFADIPADNYAYDGRTIMPGQRNNYRFPADHRLDITATWKHTLFGQPAKLNLSVYNVYSRRSYWTRYFDTSENPIEVNDIKLLPILPLISYEVRF